MPAAVRRRGAGEGGDGAAAVGGGRRPRRTIFRAWTHDYKNIHTRATSKENEASRLTSDDGPQALHRSADSAS